MADKATIKITGENDDLKSALKESEGAIEKFGSAVKKVMIAVIAAIAVKKIFDFGKEVLALADTQIQAEKKLELALKNSGDAAGYSADQLKKRASELQTMTTYGDEVILNTQAMLAGFKNINGENFDRATVAALDLSSALGTDLAGNSKKVALALAEPAKGMEMLKEAGVIFSDQQKKLVQDLVAVGDTANAQRVILEALEEKYGGAASDAADTFAGRQQQLMNRLGDVGEVIGMALIPALEGLIPVFDFMAKVIEQVIVPSVTNVIGTFSAWVGEMTGSLGPTFEWVADMALHAFTAVETIITNWSDTVGQRVLTFELAFIKSWENIKYWLTEVIPTVMEWFGENWEGLLMDYANAEMAILDNMIKNFGSFIDAIKGYIQGEDWNVEWTPLLDGFERTVKEMPKIAERVKSDTEKVYEAMLEETNLRLGNAYEKNLAKNKKVLDGLLTPNAPMKSTADVPKTAVNTDALKLSKDLAIAVTPVVAAVVKKDEKKVEAKKEDAGFSAAIEDLIGLNSRITAAAASSKPEDKVVGAVKELKDVAKMTHQAAREQIEQERQAARDRAQLNEQMSALNVNIQNNFGLA